MVRYVGQPDFLKKSEVNLTPLERLIKKGASYRHYIGEDGKLVMVYDGIK